MHLFAEDPPSTTASGKPTQANAIRVACMPGSSALIVTSHSCVCVYCCAQATPQRGCWPDDAQGIAVQEAQPLGTRPSLRKADSPGCDASTHLPGRGRQRRSLPQQTRTPYGRPCSACGQASSTAYVRRLARKGRRQDRESIPHLHAGLHDRVQNRPAEGYKGPARPGVKPAQRQGGNPAVCAVSTLLSCRGVNIAKPHHVESKPAAGALKEVSTIIIHVCAL